MNWEFHPKARAEFLDAIVYYEERSAGLGVDFALEVLRAIVRIGEYPSAWPVVSDDIRRCQMKRFPYGIVYNLELNRLFILAVTHLRRDPDCWTARKGE